MKKLEPTSMLEHLVKTEPKNIISQAYKFSEKAHQGQKRKTGEPFFNHPKVVAEILLKWKLDETTVAAALLHDVVEDTKVSHDELLEKFGPEVTFLVDGVTKLGKIKYRETSSHIAARAKVENLRKLFLALGEDLRVIFIKLADRLHNMRTLGALPPLKQKRIALETDEIYAPLAYRLGMQYLSGELKDLAFPYIFPKEHEWLLKNVPGKFEERKRYLEKLVPQVEAKLKSHHITAQTIDFRAKRLSSLYQKLLRYDMDLNKIYDLVALRIIVKNVAECYAVLGLIHELWPPLPGRIKDYIAMPKPNGYRSLHTTIIAPENHFVEVQIRTEEMHEGNEYGLAAHWMYKEGNKKIKSKKMTEEVLWVQQLRALQEKSDSISADPESFLNSMKIDFFKDRIFAITPQGEVLDLPVGATPVDFAYQIHTTIGNTCVGAKVNDRFMPLDHPLRSGDVVEIITQKNKKPSSDWLAFVKTAGAKEKIRSALSTQSKSLMNTRAPQKSELKLTVESRFGLLKEVTQVVTRSHVNILHLQTVTQAGSNFPILKIQCQLIDRSKIEKLVLKLKKVKGVREISYLLHS